MAVQGAEGSKGDVACMLPACDPNQEIADYLRRGGAGGGAGKGGAGGVGDDVGGGAGGGAGGGGGGGAGGDARGGVTGGAAAAAGGGGVRFSRTTQPVLELQLMPTYLLAVLAAGSIVVWAYRRCRRSAHRQSQQKRRRQARDVLSGL